MAYPTYIYDPYRTADPSGRPSYGYLAGLYPAAARRIQAEAKRECARLDHPGSVLYDEYPDKESILYLTDLIFFRIAESPEELVNSGMFIPITSGKPDFQNRINEDGTSPHLSSPLYDLIKTLLLQEIQRTRGEQPAEF